MTSALEENRWDSNVRQVQFALNNHVNKSTRKSPSYLLFGMNPRLGSDMVLKDEIMQNTAELLENLCDIRQVARQHIREEQEKQKQHYGRHRKGLKQYKVGDLVLIKKKKSESWHE